ncbi:MAG: DUF4440 domain-containing protein [Bacteroidia bacterium]|nr:DUF4440 domain-containing protein [Bacteroidia bacterium]
MTQKLSIVFIILITVFSFSGCDIKKPDEFQKTEIQKVLSNQETTWNNGDIESYMTGYWKNDSLRFIGKNGIQYGWQKTLDNYKKSYPDKAAMGKLKFDIISIEPICKDVAFVVGKWNLQREKGDVGGMFSLLFKKINGQWLIVFDHSS